VSCVFSHKKGSVATAKTLTYLSVFDQLPIIKRAFKPASARAGAGKRWTRGERGSALSESGPAFFLLFIFAIFPAIDLLSFALAYCACFSLNDLELREAAKAPASQAPGIVLAVQENWRSSPIGKVLATVDYPTIDVSYSDGPQNVHGVDKYITVATTIRVKPLLTIPFFPKVPGLGTDMTYIISSRRLLENANDANL
jgi:hypothetical protein